MRWSIDKMSIRKKIVFVTNNLGIGGGEIMLVEQVRCIDRKFFEPYVITILSNPKINVISKIPTDVKFIEFNFSSLFDFISLYKLWFFLRREKMEVVITSLFNANLFARTAAILAGVPVMLSYEHNIYEHKKKWQIIADRILARFTKKILVGSNDVLEFTSKQENLPKDKFQLIFNSIPLKFGNIKKNRQQMLAHYRLPEEIIYIVTAGSLTPQKGHSYLIDATYHMKQQGLKGFQVLIFGRGELKDKLLNHIQRLGLDNEVKLMGFASTEDIMAIGDIFTLPSLWEGLSIALLEAMNAGCSIVGTKISGTVEAVEDNISALLVKPGDSQGLSNALKRLLLDEKLRDKLASGARESVKRFSIEKNVKMIENLILRS